MTAKPVEQGSVIDLASEREAQAFSYLHVKDQKEGVRGEGLVWPISSPSPWAPRVGAWIIGGIVLMVGVVFLDISREMHSIVSLFLALLLFVVSGKIGFSSIALGRSKKNLQG